MKLSLSLNVFNKKDTIESVLHSWLDTLSRLHSYEVIVTCDACVDGTPDVVRSTLERYDWLTDWQVFETPDVFEITANNLALRMASPNSDIIVFIQDDNTQFSQDWDTALLQAMQWIEFPGAVALLAGGVFNADGGTYRRVECNCPHKGWHFEKHGIPEDAYPLALYSVDFVTRPFAVNTQLLRDVGGLGTPEYEKLCWDETDLCVKLLRRGYTNLYVPFDVLNTCAGQVTMKMEMERCFVYNHAIFLRDHQAWLQWRAQSAFRSLCPMTVSEGRLRIAQFIHDV